jgi:hypothetical protein
MATDNSKLVGYLIRMMPPLRREFGMRLDVQLFLNDPSYAMDVLQKGLKSTDARFRECAEYVSKLRLGLPAEDIGEPTVFSTSTYAESKPFTEAPSAPSTAAPPDRNVLQAEPTEEELRARMLKKYTSGLR